jgi:hypothetical protein
MEKTVCQQILPQTETLPIPNKPITTIAHQKFELILDNTQINSNYILALRPAAAKPDLWKYYENKYNWTVETINSINWTDHGKSLISLPQRQQKITNQFIHSIGYPPMLPTLCRRKVLAAYAHSAIVMKRHTNNICHAIIPT